MSNKLFQELDLHNKPKRNGYNLSHRVNFTAKAGELLPIAHMDCIIGDKIRINLDHFSRTFPADTAAATKIREYFDVFFVPYRLLWKNAPAVHTQNTKNPVSATSPNTNLPIGTSTPHFDFTEYYPKEVGTSILQHLIGYKNAFGYNRGFMSAKLLNHLGYGYLSVDDLVKTVNGDVDLIEHPYNGPKMLSLYPLLAYQCIYYNFFRNSQWEDNQPYNYNVDYLSQNAEVSFPVDSSDPSWQTFWQNPTLFDLHYANYPKDLFFGFFPDAQYGDEARVTVSNPVDFDSDRIPTIDMPLMADRTPASLIGSPVTATDTINGTRLNFKGTTAAVSGDLYSSLPINEITASFGILELRKQQFLQKYKEIRGSGNQTYANLVRKIFGVNIPDTLDTVPLYLGGGSSTISFSEMENTNLEGSNEAVIKGKGTGGSDMRQIEFEPKENGCIMVIYHCQPVVDYALNALHFDVVRTEADDFANPIFDQLGFQEIPSYFLDTTVNVINPDPNAPGYVNNTLGYTTRYFDYKTAVDRTLGDFRETANTWLAPVDFSYLSDYIKDGRLMLNYNFFKVNPAILDPIFALKAKPDVNTSYTIADEVVTDQIRIFSNLNISAIRPLDKDGTPY